MSTRETVSLIYVDRIFYFGYFMIILKEIVGINYIIFYFLSSRCIPHIEGREKLGTWC